MDLNCNDKKLLDKYNLSLSCLDYSYIQSATNVKEIENILLVLRSEEEGIYPDLIKFCENRLRELSPNNKLLQVIEQVKSLGELPYAEQALLHSELKTWIDDIKAKDEELRNNKKVLGTNSDYPVRNMAELKEKLEKEDSETNSFKPSVKPRSYDEWSKFDIDKEIKQIDQNETGDTIRKQSDIGMNLKEPPLPFVDTTGLSESEKQALAEAEKTKGNEHFKAKDYINSILYYGRSMSAYPTAAAVCNRAMSHIKLQNYDLAILDCESALQLDPYYVKALYRRGLSYKEMGKMQLAYMDFENALKLDSNCKEAKVQLKELSKCPIITSPGSTKKSLVIEEISSSNTTQESDSKFHSVEQNLLNKQVGEKKLENNYSNKTSHNSTIIEHLSSSAVDAPFPDKKRKSFLDSEIEAKSTKYYAKVKTDENKLRTSAEIFPTNKLNSKNEPKQISLHDMQENSGINRLTDKSIVDRKDSPHLNKSNDVSDIIEKMLGKKITGKTNVLQPNHEETFHLQNEKMTPFKFLNLWHSSNAYKDSKAGADILNMILPSELPSLISNKLDANLLNGLILAIKEFTTSGEWFKGYAFLRSIINIPRIKTISLFLSSSQLNEINQLLQIIEENQRMEITKLKDVMLGKVHEMINL